MAPLFLGFAVFSPFLCYDLPLCAYGEVDPSLLGPLASAEMGIALSPPDV